MPGIDYAQLRARVSILDVLGLLDFQPVSRRGDRLRGRCLFHCSQNPSLFVVDVAAHTYCCHSCHCGGNQLDLWRDATGLPLFHAARDLCQRLKIPVPEIDRW
jgi:DNA primase